VRHPVKRLAQRALLVLGGVLVLLGVLAGPAGAHAQLISTEPTDGAVLAKAPAAVTLTFGEAVQIPTNALEVYDAAGHAVTIGPVVHPPGQPDQVSATLPGSLHGSYVVSWRVISADTHPVSGAFTFSVGVASGGNSLGALEQHLLASRHATTLEGFLAGLFRFVVFAGVLLVVGAAALLAWWPSGMPRRSAAVAVAWAGAVVAVASLLSIAVQGSYDAAKPLTQALSSAVLHPVLGDKFGISALVRAGAALVAAFAARYASRRVGVGVLAAAAAAMIVTLSTSGHATTGRWEPLGFLLDLLHVGSAGVWLGGLAVVLAVLWWGGGDDAGQEAVARRFSAIATVTIAVIVATGVLQAWRQLGSWGALTGSTYGHLLLVKVALVGVAFEAGLFSRRLLRRRLEVAAAPVPELVTVGGAGSVPGRAAEAGSAGPIDPRARAAGPGDLPPNQNRRGRFARWIVVEALLGVAVVAVTALLVDGAPPYAEAQASSQAAFYQTQNIGHNLVSVAVYPLTPGPVEVSVQYTNGHTVVDPFQLYAQLSLPARAIGPLSVPLQHLGTGTWVAKAVDVPLPGRWRLMVGVLTDPVTEVDLNFTFTVR
jgi:copper transport protein